MHAIRTRIVAQDPDPELRRHREEALARHPWLRYLVGLAYFVALIAAASLVVRLLLA